MSGDDSYDLENLFRIPSLEEVQKNKQEIKSLNFLLSNPFSNYLIPINYNCSDNEDKAKREDNILSLSKFKELNMNKIKEDMLYYCSSADILSKLDTNNSEYLFQESDLEFYNDLSIKAFLERQDEITYFIKNDHEKKYDKIAKNKNLEQLSCTFGGENGINKTNSKSVDELNEGNIILKNIQNALKIFIKEKNNNVKNEKILIDTLDEIILNLKNFKIDIGLIGLEMFILFNRILKLFH